MPNTKKNQDRSGRSKRGSSQMESDERNVSNRGGRTSNEPGSSSISRGGRNDQNDREKSRGSDRYER